MPDITIKVTQSDIDAARRIALRMYPHIPRDDDAESVIACAAMLGLTRMKVVWLEPEKNLEGIEK
jgi:hypothetical protein